MNLTEHLTDRRKVSERLRIDWVLAIFAWPLVKHLQSRPYLSDPFLLQRTDPSVGDTPAIQTLTADWRLSEIHQKLLFPWWMERKKQANIIMSWECKNGICPQYEVFISRQTTNLNQNPVKKFMIYYNLIQWHYMTWHDINMLLNMSSEIIIYVWGLI